MNTTNRSQALLLAVADPVLHPEAMHIAAATGRPIIDSTSPHDAGRHYGRVSAVLIDREMAAAMEPPASRRERVFFLASDPGPIDWQCALSVHAEQALLLPAQAPELLAALGRDNTIAHSRGGGVCIGVLGAVGGVGASVLAVALAQRRAATAQVVLIDGDAASGGLDLLVGIEEIPGARWPDLGFARGTVQASDVLAALPATTDGLYVLSAARSTVVDTFTLTPAEIAAAVHCLRSAEGEVDVVVDLPSGQLALEAIEAVDHLVLLVPSEVRAVAAAAHLIQRLKAIQVPVSVVLRHRGWSGMDVAEVERIIAAQVIAEVGTLSRLSKTVEMQGLGGVLPRVLLTAADAIGAEL